MTHREIHTLSLLCLKEISKAPAHHIDEFRWHRAFSNFPITLQNKVTQEIINHITEAGRMNDSSIPLQAFNRDMLELSLKNSKVSENFIMGATARCPNLTSIDVSGCLLVDTSVLQKILQSCPSLTDVSIRNCRKQTDDASDCLIKHCRHLTRLNIGGNINMTTDGIIHLLRNHPNNRHFRELYLSGLPITEAVLDTLVQRCPALTHISIGYAIITESVLRRFLQARGGDLISLNISWMTAFDAKDNISVDILDCILSTCPRLTSLDVSGLRNITVQAVQAFIEQKKLQASDTVLVG